MRTFDDLIAEADRQLSVCNSCRYCEGYCAVFPALERRTLLTSGDIAQLANLCHDCRACFYSCMYAAPHEFDINPPAILSGVRRESYDTYVPRLPIPARLRGVTNVWVVTALTAVVIAGLVGITSGLGILWGTWRGAQSPYDVISYPVLLVTVVLPLAFSVTVALRAAGLYWRHIGGRLKELTDLRALTSAARYAVELRYQRGGGGECYYPGAEPNQARRRLHQVVVYGFLACVGSTVSAAIMQDLVGDDPPYPYLSAPVLLGLVGGAGLVVGCTGLTVLKARSDRDAADDSMVARDYGLLTALNVLSLTGLLSLFTRSTPAFSLVLIVHLAAVVVAFGIFPYSKFMHWVYRYLAIVKDNQERAASNA